MTASVAPPTDYHEPRSPRSPRAAGSGSGSVSGGRERCCAELGDPQLAVRGALVAGTNGKGSVLALAGSALRAAGLRVGETPKPHLVSYRERVVDRRPADRGRPTSRATCRPCSRSRTGSRDVTASRPSSSC